MHFSGPFQFCRNVQQLKRLCAGAAGNGGASSKITCAFVATDAERSYSRPARGADGNPFGKFRIDEERAARKSIIGLLFEWRLVWNLLVLGVQRGLDQAGYSQLPASGGHIRLTRADCAEFLPVVVSERFGLALTSMGSPYNCASSIVST